ncbi:MAG: putative ABC transporter ATP-binding protein YbhF [candidate division WS2 bacterium]|nr:putative ABC transporter ATP-binding protein YbhF [Candidatus Lithacetigena glycinireducens]
MNYSQKRTVIQTEGLTKYYGKVRGIEGLSLEIEEGEVFGFLGPNGAGKTTTIRLLIGLLFPTRGRGRIFNKDIVEDSVEIRKLIDYIAGDVRLYPNMKGRELLDYFSAFKPGHKPVLRKELVERFDLDLSKKVREYSRGNRQKLAIVLALMHDSPLLILDEPTLGLDPFMQREFYQVIKEFRQRGKPSFFPHT